MRERIIAAAFVTFAGAVLPVASLAAPFEQAPTFEASQVLPPALLENPYYTIQSPVGVENYRYVFSVETQWGTFRIVGTDLLRVRAREMAATAELQKVEGADTVAEAAGQAVKRPLNTVRGLFKDPGKTISDTAKGVGDFFDSVEASIESKDPHKEGAVASVTGAAKARRQLAYELGVDPYTSFKPLDEQLSRLAAASAVGSTGVGLGFTAIGGGVGTAISASSTSQSLREALRDKTAAQLEQLGRQSLATMGVSQPVADAFFKNPYLTPTDKAVTVAALAKLGNVQGREIFVKAAAGAGSVETAFAYRREADLMLDYAERIAPVAAITGAGNAAVMQTANGTVAILPADYLYWSAPIEALAASGNGQMLIPGVASKQATEEIAGLGWTLNRWDGAPSQN